MTCQKNIPLDIIYIIFEYAYNTKFSEDPMNDVEIQKNIQESIPPCFLMSKLPRPDWFCMDNHRPCRQCWSCISNTQLCPNCMKKLECILIPSPYQKGNPYFPSHCLEPAFPKFSPTINTFIGLLSGWTCKKNHPIRPVRFGEHPSSRWPKSGNGTISIKISFRRSFLLTPAVFS